MQVNELKDRIIQFELNNENVNPTNPLVEHWQ